jgi:hypothetical protein
MNNLKRTNWTTEEVIEMIKDRKIFDMEGKEANFFTNNNDVIDFIIELFQDFQRPEEEPGAMAYDMEKKEIVHIGGRLPK